MQYLGLLLTAALAVNVLFYANATLSKEPNHVDVPTTVKTTLQEDSTGLCRVTGIARENKNEHYTGAGYINPSNFPGSEIIWQVNADNTGIYEVSIRYSTKHKNSLATLTATSGHSQAITFESTDDWNHWASTSAVLSLSAGENFITLTAAASSPTGLPNIDKLTVFGDGIRPGNCINMPETHVRERIELGENACHTGNIIINAIVDCKGRAVGDSCNEQQEQQAPVLTLVNAHVKNLRVSAGGGSDGIHCIYGDCILENVVWEDVCEDAATLEHPAQSLTIIGGSAQGADDKVFQHNARSNSILTITGGFQLKGNNSKLWRSCGNCKDNGGPRHLHIEDATIEGSVKIIASANVNYQDSVTIDHISFNNYRAESTKICVENIGVTEGEPSSGTERWNTQTCKVDPSNIIAAPD